MSVFDLAYLRQRGIGVYHYGIGRISVGRHHLLCKRCKVDAGDLGWSRKGCSSTTSVGIPEVYGCIPCSTSRGEE